MKSLSNNQCQNCHAVQFAGFAKGHPEFTKYPFDRRTRIIFDHDSHWNKHFKEGDFAKSAPQSCLNCHQTDLKGGTMVLKPFEAICASCHEDQIKGKGAVKAGIAFIAIPRMDDRVLTGEYGIGEWPEDADQPMTPFMRLLLSSDPNLRAALDSLGDADLANLPKSDAAKIKAAQQVAWGIKGLILDLSSMGQEELIKRMSAALNHSFSDREKEGATGLLGADALRTAFQSSFPKLQAEVTEYRDKKTAAQTELVPSPPLAKNKSKTATPESWVSNGGWYSPEGSFSLFYRPRGHTDRFLTSWMNLTVDAEK
ncbi:MAG: cytochrome c3 family protein, partial [Verrucomicrobiota bacterium]